MVPFEINEGENGGRILENLREERWALVEQLAKDDLPIKKIEKFTKAEEKKFLKVAQTLMTF